MRLTLLAIAAASAAVQGAKINHFIYLMLENRAFDHMLGWVNRWNPEIRGLTGNESNLLNPLDPNSTRYPITDTAAFVDPDPGHEVTDTAQQIYGHVWGALHNVTAPMDGFVANAINHTGVVNAPLVMRSFAPEHVPIISTLATDFAVVDNYFSSVPGPTYINRLYSTSATSWGYGTNSLNQTLHGWPQLSIFRALSNANVTWRAYLEEAATAWLYQDTRHLDTLANCKQMGDFFTDVAAGSLPTFTWLDPSYFTIPGVVNATDQHPAHDVLDGERLMKRVYEALRASPLWNDSVLVITYDEHGGFPDFVPPPFQGVPNPDGLACRDCGNVDYNFDRLGVRVPFIVVSPWIAKGTVLHDAPDQYKPTPDSQMEHSSLPATLHHLYNTVGPNNGFLTGRDAWATPFHWIWEDSPLAAPRTDCPATLPPVPESSPSFVGKVNRGDGPITGLHRDLLYLAHGLLHDSSDAAGEAAHALRTPTVAQVEASLTAHGLRTEAAAGRWMRAVASAKLAAARARVEETRVR